MLPGKPRREALVLARGPWAPARSREHGRLTVSPRHVADDKSRVSGAEDDPARHVGSGPPAVAAVRRGTRRCPRARRSRNRGRQPYRRRGMVGARGFEPPTSSSRTMRATKLRHAPTEVLVVQSPGIVARCGRTAMRHPAGGAAGCRASPQAAPVRSRRSAPRPSARRRTAAAARPGAGGAAMHHLGTVP